MRNLNNKNRKSLDAVRERERERESCNLSNKAKRSVVVRRVVACGALICAGAVIIATVKNKPKLEIAVKQVVDKPKAITEVVAGTPNLNNVHYEPSLEKDENGEFIQVPVPRGYIASGVDDERYVNGVTENGVRVHSGGFVIYEGTEPVTSENLDEAQRTRNQYVWVPIDRTEATEGKMYNITNGVLYGNYYNFTTSGAGNPVTGISEPRLLTSYDEDRIYLKQYMEGISGSELLQEMREEFYEMIVSVKTYGGFYIGRYETGNIRENELKVVKMQTGTTSDGSANNNINEITWYKAYLKSRGLRGTAPVSTNLIWGIQWDETLKWLIESVEKTASEVVSASVSWGNYRNATFTYTNTRGGTSTKRSGVRELIPTGSAEYTKANNIYDLAGNVFEWTMESNGGRYRYIRGGAYNATSNPVNIRLDENPDYGYYTFGARVSLCLT